MLLADIEISYVADSIVIVEKDGRCIYITADVRKQLFNPEKKELKYYSSW